MIKQLTKFLHGFHTFHMRYLFINVDRRHYTVITTSNQCLLITLQGISLVKLCDYTWDFNSSFRPHIHMLFPVATAKLWNELPGDVTAFESLIASSRRLKTFCFVIISAFILCTSKRLAIAVFLH